MQFHHILVNNRQKTSADGICFSLHVLSMFSPLLLLLLAVNLLSTEFSDRGKLSSYCSSTLVRCCDKLTASWKCCYIYTVSRQILTVALRRVQSRVVHGFILCDPIQPNPSSD